MSTTATRDSDTLDGVVRLRLRTWPERAALAPFHFWKIASIGRGKVPLWARLHSAFVLTRHLLRRVKPNAELSGPMPLAAEGSRSNAGLETMTVINLAQAEADREPHLSGKARCLACKHEWVAVAPVGVVWMECPACTLERGRYVAQAERERSE